MVLFAGDDPHIRSEAEVLSWRVLSPPDDICGIALRVKLIQCGIPKIGRVELKKQVQHVWLLAGLPHLIDLQRVERQYIAFFTPRIYSWGSRIRSLTNRFIGLGCPINKNR